MNTDIKVWDMTDEQLLETYYYVSEKCATRTNETDASLFSTLANVYSTELTRRESIKANIIMRKWTIAIGIMTAVMLIATIANIFII